MGRFATTSRKRPRIGCVAGVSVWVRSNERPRDEEEWDFRFSPHLGFAPFFVRSLALALVLCS